MALLTHDEGKVRSKRILVFGSRDFNTRNNYLMFVEIMDEYLKIHGLLKSTDWCFVSGGAKGPDAFIIYYAKKKGYDWIEYIPEWTVNGKTDLGAGYKRNAEMSLVATHAVGFWNLISKGTRDMFQLCQKKKIDTLLIHTRYAGKMNHE